MHSITSNLLLITSFYHIQSVNSQCWNLLYSGAGCITSTTIDYCVSALYTTLSQCTSACNTAGIGYDYASWSAYDLALGYSVCCCSTSACSQVPDISYNAYRKGSCNTVTTTPNPTSPTSPPGPTPSPTTSPPTPSPTAVFASYSGDDVNSPLLIAATIFTGLGFIISTIFLCIHRKKIQQDSSRGTVMETLKEMSMMDRIFIVLKIADVFTDFIFAVDILLSYDNEIVIIFGWIAFMTGVIGMALFGVKLLLMRKVLYRIKKLKEEREKLRDDEKVQDVVVEIRARNNLILFFDLLCASLEDCPQLTIVLMISIYSGFESVTALLDLAVTMLTLFWCPIAIMVSYCGCSDDRLKEEDDQEKSTGTMDKDKQDGDVDGGRTETVQMMVPSQRKETGQSGVSGMSDNGLPAGWRMAYTEDGRVYFQNDITKETQWKHPSTTQHMYV